MKKAPYTEPVISVIYLRESENLLLLSKEEEYDIDASELFDEPIEEIDINVGPLFN